MPEVLLILGMTCIGFFLGSVFERRMWTHRDGIVVLDDCRYIIIKTPPLKKD